MGDGDEVFGPNTIPAEGYFVCDDCFQNDVLRALIRSNACNLTCDFCARTSRRRLRAAPLQDVVTAILASIAREYDDAADNLGWESAEGGYYGNHWDSYDLLMDQVGLELPNDDGKLFKIISNCLGDQIWCERNPYTLREDTRLVYSWEQFSNSIKYEHRYFFLEGKRKSAKHTDEELLPPSELLKFM